MTKTFTERLKFAALSFRSPQQAAKDFKAFRFLILIYLVSELTQQSVAISYLPSPRDELASPSRLLAIIIIAGVFIFLETLRLISKAASTSRKYEIGYMIFIFLSLSIIPEEFSYQTQIRLETEDFAPVYQFTIFKILIAGFIPNNLAKCLVLWTDALYLFIRIPAFHSHSVITPAIISLIAPIALALNSMSEKANATPENEPCDKFDFDGEWAKDVLGNLHDGLAVFDLYRTVRYVNPELRELLDANEENVIDMLMQLPNRDLVSHMADGGSLTPSTCTSTKLVVESGSTSFKKIPGSSHHLQNSHPKKSLFHTGNQNYKLDNFENSKCSSMIDLGNEGQNSQYSPTSRGKLTHRESDNKDPSNNSLDSSRNIPLLSFSKPKLSKITERKARTPDARSIRNLYASSFRKASMTSSPNRTITAKTTLSKKESPKSPYIASMNFLESAFLSNIEKTSDDQALRLHPVPESFKANLLKGYKSTRCESVGETIDAMLAKARRDAAEGKRSLAKKSLSWMGRITLKKEKVSHFRSQHSGEVEEEQEVADSISISTFHKSGDDKVKYIDVMLKVIDSQGEKLLLVMAKDMTFRDMTQRLQSLNLKKSETLAVVSHEYRTPLNGISSMLEMLSEKVHPILEEQYVRPALINTKRLLSLVNDILDYHQLQNNKLNLVHKPCCLQELIQNVFKVLEIPAGIRGLELDFKIDPSVPYEIVTDSGRLEQILLNLASNALKFTEKGGIYVHVTAPKVGKVTIQVRDTGIGIKDSNLSKLFRCFGKVDLGSKSSLNPTGVGLGLVISNALSKSLHSDENEGGLRVESVYGKGSCFYFTIDDLAYREEENFYFSNEDRASMCSTPKEILPTKPMSIVMSPVSSRSQEVYSFVNSGRNHYTERPFGAKLQVQHGVRDFEHLMNRNYQARRDAFQSPESIFNIPSEINQFTECPKCKSILAVDDDPFNILALQKVLNHFGFQNVDHASNGAEALKMIKEKAKSDCHNRYKIIFLDCCMPVLNGYETATEIRNLISKGEIPDQIIIGATANVESGNLSKCISSGMNDTVIKPLTKNHLHEKLNKWLGKV